MIEAMGVNLLHPDPLEWHYFRTKFHEILLSGSKVISGGHTDRHIGDLISLLSLFESRPNNRLFNVVQ
jgi:hypothetical protein